MVGREEVFESTAQYPLFRYSIPMMPEAAQFGGTPACQWFSGLELCFTPDSPSRARAVVPEQVAEKCHAAAPAAKAVMKTSCLTQR